MFSLEAAQANFIETINDGPAMLAPDLFDGPMDRILLGLAAHANTINHARLIALEDTFPRTRAVLGVAPFNALCSIYIETDEARTHDINSIGSGFIGYLGRADLAELAQIEWAWLQSFHAAEAAPLTLADLDGMDEAALLALPVKMHPAARLVKITTPLSPALEALAGTQPAAILTLRPDAEVLLMPLDGIQLAIFIVAAKQNAMIGNLLGTALEIAGETAPLGPVMDLIGAGALIRNG